MRWGLGPDGRRHLVHTHTDYLGRPSVTPVALCGADLEILAGSGTAWDESSTLGCAQCTTMWAGWTVAAQTSTDR
jgi:hypothetical protein